MNRNINSRNRFGTSGSSNSNRRMGASCSACLTRYFTNSRGGDRERDEREMNISRPPNLASLDYGTFTVRGVNLLIRDNAYENHTSNFYVGDIRQNYLIIRRGATFNIEILLSTAHMASDIINLVFSVADVRRPNHSKRTEVIVPLKLNVRRSFQDLPVSTDGLWSAHLVESKGNLLIVSIISSHNAIIGEWIMRIETKSRDFDLTSTYHVRDKIFILFNAWSKKDATYMRSEREKNEYLMNENGIIWRGVHNVLRPTPWSYGQFEESVLECCCYVLSRVGRLSPSDRSDPIRVSRHISAVVNSFDDEGIVEGNWGSDFYGGRAPTSWMGSASILQQYFMTKKPVKYGQCWVFSGVATTICRCLGIPSRCVTNYQSAHDTHSSLTVDRFFNRSLEPIDERNTDSIWNFHTWTEGWMARLDLAPGYDGWQVIDATPQEASDGLFRCGPASVAAVRKGDVRYSYDTGFVYAEVNADEVFWLYDEDNDSFKLLKYKTQSVGRKISTKSVGSNFREDITDSYKARESSQEERDIMIKVLKTSESPYARYYLREEFEDVKFELQLLDDILIGSPFTVRLMINNRSTRAFSIVGFLQVRSTYYTGRPHEVVKSDRREVILAPTSVKELAMMVPYEDYERHLIDQNSFEVTAAAEVLEFDHQYESRDDFRVRMPDVKFEVEGDIIQGKPFTCHAYLHNPIPKPLTRCYFMVEGAGLMDPLRIPLKKSVGVGEEARVTFVVIPKGSGDRTISGKFYSRELGSDVDGFRNIRVAPSLVFDENDVNANILNDE